MKQTSLLIKSLFKQIMKHPIKSYFSQAHTIQSSVGIIFKFTDKENIQTKQQFDNQILNQTSIIDNTQLLFVQRAGYHLDKNAYNIVFPGGQCDKQESDLQACQRQLKEEIGISTKDQCIYLGKLPRNFYYMKKRGKQVHISCQIFCLKSSNKKWQPKLNQDELRKFKWVKVSELLKKQNYKIKNEIKLGVFQRMPSFASSIAKQHVTNVTMPELDLGMQRNLWGLTLWIWSYVLQMSLSSSYKSLNDKERYYFKNIICSMKTLNLQFKPGSLFKYPVQLVASGWHYFYRVRPFTYKSNQSPFFLNLKRNILVILLLVTVLSLYFQVFNINIEQNPN